jgi:hypothetical protein
MTTIKGHLSSVDATSACIFANLNLTIGGKTRRYWAHGRSAPQSVFSVCPSCVTSNKPAAG